MLNLNGVVGIRDKKKTFCFVLQSACTIFVALK